MKGNFYHKIGVAELLAEMLKRPMSTDRGDWILSVALDLQRDDPKRCETEFAVEIIARTNKGRQKAKQNGKKGAKTRWENERENKDLDSDPIANDSDPIASSRSRSKSNKDKYGEFENVLLTSEEHEKLKEGLNGSCDDYIERLSAYIAQSGKRYKSHYATILNWSRKDKKEQPDKNQFTDSSRY